MVNGIKVRIKAGDKRFIGLTKLLGSRSLAKDLKKETTT